MQFRIKGWYMRQLLLYCSTMPTFGVNLRRFLVEINPQVVLFLLKYESKLLLSSISLPKKVAKKTPK